jgi:hypothetical protein
MLVLAGLQAVSRVPESTHHVNCVLVQSMKDKRRSNMRAMGSAKAKAKGDCGPSIACEQQIPPRVWRRACTG